MHAFARITAVGRGKGGVGKTPTALNLAVMAAIAGRKVKVCNFDPQDSIIVTLDLRARLGHQPAVDFAIATPDNLVQLLSADYPVYDEILIDIAGYEDDALYQAFCLADQIVFPSKADTDATNAMPRDTAALAQVQLQRPDLVVHAFWTDLPSHASVRAARLAELPTHERAYPMLDFAGKPLITRTELWSQASAQGLAVVELQRQKRRELPKGLAARLDLKPSRELTGLYEAVFGAAFDLDTYMQADAEATV